MIRADSHFTFRMPEEGLAQLEAIARGSGGDFPPEWRTQIEELLPQVRGVVASAQEAERLAKAGNLADARKHVASAEAAFEKTAGSMLVEYHRHPFGKVGQLDLWAAVRHGLKCVVEDARRLAYRP